jgi:hypothetical protein
LEKEVALHINNLNFLHLSMIWANYGYNCHSGSARRCKKCKHLTDRRTEKLRVFISDELSMGKHKNPTQSRYINWLPPSPSSEESDTSFALRSLCFLFFPMLYEGVAPDSNTRIEIDFVNVCTYKKYILLF